MYRTLKRGLVVAAAFALPYVCMAAAPYSEDVATRNRVRAAAGALRAKVKEATPPEHWTPDWQEQFGAPRKQMLLTPRNPQGHVMSQMVCIYNREDQVIRIRPASPTERYDYRWDYGY